MVNIGVVGYGYWGPNIVRNFNSVDGARLISICDIDSNSLNRARKSYPNLEFFSNYHDIIYSKKIDAVAIVTPVSSN